MYTKLQDMQKAEDSQLLAIALQLIDGRVPGGVKTNADQPLYAAIEAMLSAREALAGPNEPDLRGDDVAA